MARRRSNRRRSRLRQVYQFLREHSLTVVLVIILGVQLTAFWIQGLDDWRSDQRAHDESTAIWPDYMSHFATELWGGLMADTYGAILLVVLTKYFWEYKSAESRK